MFAATVLAGAFAFAAPPTLVDAPCPHADTPGYEQPAEIRCATLTVPENRAIKNGRTLDLMVVIVKSAAGAAKQPEPIVYLHGGPGVHVFREAPRLTALRERMRRGHDFVLFEQRGVNHSGDLCPDLARRWLAIYAEDHDAAGVGARAVEEIRACRAQAGGADWSAYTAYESAADVEDLRIALGAPRVNLIGVSYGTELAQYVLERYPDSVRSTLLDSVAPSGEAWWPRIPDHFARAFRKIDADCAADPKCAARYGSLEALLGKAAGTLAKEPLPADVDPAEGLPGNRLVWNPTDFGEAVFQLLYYDDVHGTLPLLLDRFAARDALVARRIAEYLGPEIRANAWAAYFATSCTGAPRATRTPTHDVYETSTAAWWSMGETVCADLALPLNPLVERPRTASASPVLAFAGERDPITPPADADRVAKTLCNARVVRFPQAAHGVLFGRSGDCAFDLYFAFLADPAAPLDTACAGAVPATTFASAPVVNAGVFRFADGVLQMKDVPAALATALIIGIALFGLVGPLVARWRGPLAGAVASRRVAMLSAALTLASIAALAAAVVTTAATAPLLLLIGLDGPHAFALYTPWLAGAVGLAAIARARGNRGVMLVGGAGVAWLALAWLLGLVG